MENGKTDIYYQKQTQLNTLTKQRALRTPQCSARYILVALHTNSAVVTLYCVHAF